MIARDRQPSWYFHFVKDSHDTRLGFIEHMTKQPILCLSTIMHKTKLVNRDACKLDYMMYLYALKLLLERITWYAERLPAARGIRNQVGLTLSSWRGLNETKVWRYLDNLHYHSAIDAEYDVGISTNNINWLYLDKMNIRVVRNQDHLGLLYADAVASGVAKAIDVNTFGHTEQRYVKMLKPVIHCYRNSYFSYGLKFFAQRPTVDTEGPRMSWLKRFEK